MPPRTRWQVRPAGARGRSRLGWLDSRHSFSFGDYYDPEFMGFRSLRVINEDRVAPGAGFDTHRHRDMEIFSYVLSGALEHRDSLGNGRVLRPGEIQLMSAGRGVAHSEFNPSQDAETHFLQVWIQPRQAGSTPSYTEWRPDAEAERAAKVLLISPDGRGGSARVHQDAEVYRVRLDAGASAAHELGAGRGAWVQVIRGELAVDGQVLAAGDGAGTEHSGSLDLIAVSPAEALLFDIG